MRPSGDDNFPVYSRPQTQYLSLVAFTLRRRPKNSELQETARALIDADRQARQKALDAAARDRAKNEKKTREVAQIKEEQDQLIRKLSFLERKIQEREARPDRLSRISQTNYVGETLSELEKDPVVEMIKLLEAPPIGIDEKTGLPIEGLTAEKKLAYWEKLLSYVVPKVKAVHKRSEEEINLKVTVTGFTKDESGQVVNVRALDAAEMAKHVKEAVRDHHSFNRMVVDVADSRAVERMDDERGDEK